VQVLVATVEYDTGENNVEIVLPESFQFVQTGADAEILNQAASTPGSLSLALYGQQQLKEFQHAKMLFAQESSPLERYLLDQALHMHGMPVRSQVRSRSAWTVAAVCGVHAHEDLKCCKALFRHCCAENASQGIVLHR
jgi:hypothetical protein